MRKVPIFNLLCLISIWFLISISASAACPDVTNSAGYVRAGAGGSATGADWTNAYTSLPSSLSRGCTYYVATGTYGGHYFNDADSGTSVITVQAATIASHGTATGWSSAYQGQAIFDTSDSSAVGDIITFGADYYVFNGVYRSTSTGNPQTDWSTESGYGFKVNNQTAKVGTDDVCFGCNSATKATPYHNIIFEYVDVNGSHSGDAATGSGARENGLESAWGSYNITVEYNYIHDTGLTILFITGQHCANGSVVTPPCTRGTLNGGTYGTGDSVNVQYNYFARNYSDPSQHAEGCSCHEGLTNLTLANNFWQDINGTAGIAPATSCDYNNCNQNNGPWNIYGNVFFMTSCSAVSNGDKNPGIVDFVYLFDSQFSGTLYVFNNTIYNYGTGCGIGSGVALEDGTYENPMHAVYVENNTWQGAAGIDLNMTCPSSGGAVTCTSITTDYNAYFASTDGSPSNDTSAHKQVSGSNGPFTSIGGYDFRLTANTSAGLNTGSLLAANNNDLLTTARGANGTWDRGAFQIASTSAAPAAPSNLIIMIALNLVTWGLFCMLT